MVWSITSARRVLLTLVPFLWCLIPLTFFPATLTLVDRMIEAALALFSCPVAKAESDSKMSNRNPKKKNTPAPKTAAPKAAAPCPSPTMNKNVYKADRDDSYAATIACPFAPCKSTVVTSLLPLYPYLAASGPASFSKYTNPIYEAGFPCAVDCSESLCATPVVNISVTVSDFSGSADLPSVAASPVVVHATSLPSLPATPGNKTFTRTFTNAAFNADDDEEEEEASLSAAYIASHADITVTPIHSSHSHLRKALVFIPALLISSPVFERTDSDGDQALASGMTTSTIAAMSNSTITESITIIKRCDSASSLHGMQGSSLAAEQHLSDAEAWATFGAETTHLKHAVMPAALPSSAWCDAELHAVPAGFTSSYVNPLCTMP